MEAVKLTDDPKEVECAERILHRRRMIQVANMTLLSGFVLGSARPAITCRFLISIISIEYFVY